MSNGYAFSFEHSDSISVDINGAGLSTTVVPILLRLNAVPPSIYGTAFCLAQFASGDTIFATAKHVIAELVDTQSLQAFVLLPKTLENHEDRNSLTGVTIHQIALAEGYSDVALVVANPKRSELPVVSDLKPLPVTFGSPQVGEYCMSIGYPQEPGSNAYEMMASRGVIEEVHPRRRDSVLSTFPSFRTNAQYKHGMSGGPIIDIRGRVIGLISHGTEADDPENVTGYGASIGAMIELKLDLEDDNGNVQEFAIPQLAEMGFLGSKKDEAITLRRDDDGVTLIWTPPNDN